MTTTTPTRPTPIRWPLAALAGALVALAVLALLAAGWIDERTMSSLED